MADRISLVHIFIDHSNMWGGVRKHETGWTLNGRTFDEMPHALEAVG